MKARVYVLLGLIVGLALLAPGGGPGITEAAPADSGNE